jgi:hypothetical protein
VSGAILRAQDENVAKRVCRLTPVSRELARQDPVSQVFASSVGPTEAFLPSWELDYRTKDGHPSGKRTSHQLFVRIARRRRAGISRNQ